MNRRTLLTRLALLGGAVGGGWWLRDRVLWRRPEVSFSGDGDWLDWAERRTVVPTVMAMVAGRPVRALIDSGAQYSVIDRRLHQSLGAPRTFDMPVVAYGVGGQAQLGKGATLEVVVGGASISGLRSAILDLGVLAEVDGGLATPLILGQDVLSEVLLEMDLRERRLRLLPVSTPLPPDVRPIETRRAGRSLRTVVTVEGATVEAVVDTGASSLLALNRSTGAAAGLLDGRPQSRGSSLVLGGTLASTVVQARTITIGDDLHQRVDTPIFDQVPVPGFPEALVGMAAFEDRRLVMDMGGGRLHVSRALDLTVG